MVEPITVICDKFVLVPVKRKSPTEKNVVNEVPVPVTAVPARVIVPAPAVDVLVENVALTLLINLSLPIVSFGTAVTVGVA